MKPLQALRTIHESSTKTPIIQSHTCHLYFLIYCASTCTCTLHQTYRSIRSNTTIKIFFFSFFFFFKTNNTLTKYIVDTSRKYIQQIELSRAPLQSIRQGNSHPSHTMSSLTSNPN
uniref:Uncharacterized protein n=1 Tax=Manihot esculenta TaxID=3983 RepID=A0A2C9UB40_MANES